MRIDLEHMRKLHKIQLEMFGELKRVMDELNICYYFVHGSLLGAVTSHQFIEEDDDIDIAIFRQDYERLMKNGNNIVSSNFFIQDCKNDDFPLGFAKMRRNNTEFYQPVIERCKCHKGIYIDIFPIDFVSEKENLLFQVKNKILQARINSRLNIPRGLKQKGLAIVSKVLYPSYQQAIKKRETLYAMLDSSKYVSIFSGKPTEQRLLNCWFGEGVQIEFCGIMVNCPSNYDAYLTTIYGAKYREKNPAEHRMFDNGMVEISACYVDFGDGEVIGQK